VDGYYDSILSQIERGQKDTLIKTDKIIHSENTPRKALDFCVNILKTKVVKDNKEGLEKEESPLPKKSDKLTLFVFLKSLFLLPVILGCYTMLFMITVNFLMSIGNGPSAHSAPVKTTLSNLPFVVEFFGLIAVLLLACKHIK